MAKQRINPVALMALVILVLATVVWTVLVVTTAGELKEQVEGAGAAKPPIAKLRAEVRKQQADIDGMEAALALRSEDLRMVEREAAGHRISGNAAGITVSVSPRSPYEPETNPLLPPEADGTAGKTRFLNTLQGQALSHILVTTSDLDSDRKILTAAIEPRGGDVGARYRPLRDAIDQRQEDLARILEKINEEETRYREDDARLNEQLAKLTELRAAEDKRLRTTANLKENEILKQEDEIRRLLELELKFMTAIEPVGGVLEVAAEADRAVIDLGTGDRIRPGMLFEVFQYENGRFGSKGLIEVIEASAGTSVCRIRSQVDIKRNPIAKGDRIGNPLFNTKRPKVFVLAGDFAMHNAGDYEAFITTMGNEVRRDIGPGVDYLVVRGDDKDRSDTARARAREFHVLGMTEAQLLTYLPRTFPTIARGATKAAQR
ncbi:MAG: hypothetical protein RLZZ127_702 [Planctomycetota bacterium]